MRNLGLTICFILSLLSNDIFAQKQQITIIEGIVTDALTKEAISFATIAIPKTNIGTTTDIDGKYFLEFSSDLDSIEISYLGYESFTVFIQLEKKQTLNIALNPSIETLNEVVVTNKKKRYRNKDNPAVALIKKVRKKQHENRPEAQAYMQYEQYEKIELGLDNISKKFKNKKIFKNFQFVFDYVDTFALNNKAYLPIYFEEIAATIYHRKSPKARKEYQHAISKTEINQSLDADGIDYILEKLYQDFDVYDSELLLLNKQFTGPLSPIGPNIYKYYINDTIEFRGHRCIDLRFHPRNTSSLAFIGNFLIEIDSSFAILAAEMEISKNTNINFINTLYLKQEFQATKSGLWLPSLNSLFIDLKLTKKGVGMYGKRTVSRQNFIFNQAAKDSIYDIHLDIIKPKDELIAKDSFWLAARHVPLSRTEEGVYFMMDSIQKSPTFKRWTAIGDFLLGGYLDIGGISLGSMYSIYSFNSVEGSRFRLGMKTNDDFSEKLWLSGMAIYGTKDKRWKYALEARYALTDKIRKFPRHELGISYSLVTNYPGLNFQFVDDDNFFLSFKRGDDSKILLLESLKIDYLREFRNNFSFHFSFKRETQQAYGSLKFDYFDENNKRSSAAAINTSQFGLTLRYSPQQSIYQGKNHRKTIKTNHPIYTFMYQYSPKGVFGSEYEYHRFRFNLSKRIRAGVLGYGDAILDMGNILGKKLPFTLLNLPEANQSFFYNPLSYNMMNFLEFSTDKYISLFYTQFFEGLIFNSIPLLKKLKLRSLVSCKVLYGEINDDNNPNLNPELIQYPKTKNGTSYTRSLDKQPYIEASVGIYNIFKVLRFDLVKRITYLDSPDIPSVFGVKGLAIRARFKVSF